jgi:hypothetical protein
MAQDLKMSLRHARNLPIYQIMESWFLHNSLYSDKMKSGFTLDLAHLMSNYSTIPSAIGAKLNGNYFGFWQRYLLGACVMQEGAEKLVREYLSPDSIFHQRSMSDMVNRRSPRSEQSSEYEMKNIFRKLNIQNRRLEESVDPKVFAAVKVKDQDVFILPVSLNTMPTEVMSLFDNGRFDFNQIERFLRQGINFNIHSGGFIQEITRKVPTSIGLPIVLNIKIPTVARLTGNLKVEMSSPIENVKALVDLKPSIVSTLVVKMESWSPIVNSGLKSLTTLKANTPIKAKIEASNLKQSQPSLTVSIKTIKEYNNIASIESRPVTFTRVWPKTMQVWQEPQEKTLPCEELKKISTADITLPEEILGIKYRVKTDIRNSPLKYKIQLTSQPGYETPEEVVFKFTSQKWKETLESEMRPSMSSDVEEMISGECQRVCEQCSYCESCKECQEQKYNENSQKALNYYKSYSSDKSLKTQMKIEVYTTGSSINRKIEIVKSIRCDSDNKYCKVNIDLLRTPIPSIESQPWKLECRGQSLRPQTPYQINEVSSDKKYLSNIKCRWGHSEQDMNTKYFDLSFKAQQSWEQRQQLSYDQETEYCRQCIESQRQGDQQSYECSAHCSPVSMYEQISKWSDLCDMEFVAKYQNVHPVAKNITNKLYRALKHAFYWESSVNQINVQNEQNTIRGKITIEPKTHRFVNITIKAPKETTKFINIESKLPLIVANSKKMLNSKYQTSNPFARFVTSENRLYTQPICKISSSKIKTFDGVTYRAPITTCYTVLAKDCGNSESSKFAVLIKKLSDSTEMKKLKILTKHNRIEIEPATTSSSSISVPLKVMVNGEIKVTTRVQYSNSLESSTEELSESIENYSSKQTLHEVIEHGHVVCRIVKVGPYVKLEMPEAGIKVYFDGYSSDVKMSQLYKSSQCGLCGQYDLETSNEFHTAQNKKSKSITEFFSSYLVKNDDECQISQSELQRIQKEDEYTPRTPWKSNSLTSNTNNRQQYSNELTDDEDSYQTSRLSSSSYDSLDSLYNNQLTSRVSGEPKSPVYKTKLIEHGHEICLSKQPVAQCPHHSYPTSYQPQQKTVVYACVERNQPQTEVIHQKALSGERIPELTTIPASFTKHEAVPENCVTI